MFEFIKKIFANKSSKEEIKNREALAKDIAGTIGILTGNEMSRNSQLATDTMTEGMKLFLKEADRVINVDVAQSKGNLFEYIEAAKFNVASAKIGSDIRAVVTASNKGTNIYYNPHSPADILLTKNDKIIQEIQAKAGTNAKNLVFEHTGFRNGEIGKYDGMARLIPKDADDKMLEEARNFAKAKSEVGLDNSKHYKDVYENLENKLKTKDGKISSEGTSIDELKKAKENPEAYAKDLQQKQLGAEITDTAANMAIASAITTGIVSSAKNIYEVVCDGKELDKALKEIGINTAKGAARGGVTGAVSASIRYFGNINEITGLKDSCVTTVIAGGLVDCGVALWAYANNEIDSAELKNNIIDSSVKGVSTIILTKAIGTVVGTATGALLPMVIFTAASCALASGREIIKKANLAKAQSEKIEAIVKQMTALKEEYRKELLDKLKAYEAEQISLLNRIINNIDDNLINGNNYELATKTIGSLANQMGISLKYQSKIEFDKFMQSNETLILD